MHSLPAIRLYLSFLLICQTQNSRFLLSQLSKTVIFSVLLIPGKGREKWFILSSPPSSCNFCRVCLVIFLHRKQVGITESLVRRENSSVGRGLHIGRHCSVPVSTINFFGKGTESPSYQIHQAEKYFSMFTYSVFQPLSIQGEFYLFTVGRLLLWIYILLFLILFNLLPLIAIKHRF